jgi:hypothetical protein
VGVSKSTIDVAPVVSATVGGTIKAATGDVAAPEARPASAATAAARSTGASGGLLIGIDATRTVVTHGGSVAAGIVAGAALTVAGATTVSAAGSARHTAEADSIAAGAVAVGVSYAKATSSATVAATVGANATVTGGSLSISATRDHDQFADNFAGGGGVAAGASATAATAQTGGVTATVGSHAKATLSGGMTVNAASTTTVNGRVRAISGGLLAGAAALLYTLRVPQGIIYSGGFLLGIKAFSAAVLGGIGNLRGALLGGLILGVMENYGQALFGTQWRDVVAFVLLVLVLLVRPTGILGESLGKARA